VTVTPVELLTLALVPWAGSVAGGGVGFPVSTAKVSEMRKLPTEVPCKLMAGTGATVFDATVRSATMRLASSLLAKTGSVADWDERSLRP
jgi:hypothetical protein